MGFLDTLGLVKECIETFTHVLSKGVSTTYDELPDLQNGKRPAEVIKHRVWGRYKEKAALFTNPKKLTITFKQLFDLPPWLTLDQWVTIQLRGRDVDDLFDLNLDHIVPLSVVESLEELNILMSWKNTRLIDPDINTKKSSFADEENTLLMKRLLGRGFPENWDGSIGRVVEPEPIKEVEPVGFRQDYELFRPKARVENSDRLQKLLNSKKTPSKKSPPPRKKRK